MSGIRDSRPAVLSPLCADDTDDHKGAPERDTLSQNTEHGEFSMILRSQTRAAIFGLFVLAGIEGLLRATVPENELLFAWEHPEGMIGLLGGRVYVRESSDQHATDGDYPYEYRTNSLGLREDNELTPSVSKDTKRFLALGDSWVFGTSVTQGKTLPDQIEVELGKRLNQSVEVVNAGIPGGSAFDMLARWNELRAQYEFDGVIFNIPHNVSRQKELTASRKTLFQPGGGAPYINWRTYLVVRRLIAPWTRTPYAEGVAAEPVEEMMADLKTIVEQAQSMGMSVTAVEDPGRLQDAVGVVRQLDLRWRSALEPMGVVFSGHALNTRDCWGFYDHGHPAEAGAKVLAVVVAQAMATGSSTAGLETVPSCSDVEGVGPGKPGWPVPE